MTDPSQGANGPQGAMSPEQLKELTSSLLTTLRSDINAAITTRMGGRGAEDDLREQVKSLADTVQSLQSAGNGQPAGAAGKGKSNEPEQDDDRVAELQRRLDANQAELLKERRTAALRDSLSKTGVRPEAMEDALRLLSLRDDIKPTKDQHGEMRWEGQVNGQLGDRVAASLDDVVSEFVGSKRYMVAPTSAGGSGAFGGNAPAGGKPVEQMTDQELASMTPEQAAALWEAGGGNSSKGGFFS